MSWSKHTRNTNPFGDLKLTKDDYLSPAEYVTQYGHHVEIAGAYINRKAKHGAHPVIIAKTPSGFKGISLGRFACEQWEEILADAEDVEAIKQGKASGELEERHSEEYNKDYYALVF